MTQFFLVMLGGGIGAVIRAFVTNFFNNRIHSTYPIATLVVNILGSFLIGLCMGLTLNVTWINTFLIVGIAILIMRKFDKDKVTDEVLKSIK